MLRRCLRKAAILAASLAAHGCAFSHRCRVPDPVVEAAGPPRIPLTVAIRHEPPSGASLFERQNDPYHRWSVDADPPARALFDRLAASMFERVTPAPTPGDPATGADAVLEIRLDAVAFDFRQLGPYWGSVAFHATLRSPDGAEIGALDVKGTAQRPLGYELSTHCKGIGETVALAMQDAGESFLARFPAEPAVASWLSGRGVAPAAPLEVRPAASYAEAPAEDGTATGATVAPAPVRVPRAMPPHTFHFRVGLGAIAPDESAGRLEGARTGVALAFGAEYRPRPWLGLEIEALGLHRTYSAVTAPDPGGFVRLSGFSADSRSLGVGARAIRPGRIAEPWVGAAFHLVHTELCVAGSLFGFSGCTGQGGTDLGPGFDMAAGLMLHVAPQQLLSLEVRRLFVRARFDVFDGRDVSVGGTGALVSYGFSLP